MRPRSGEARIHNAWWTAILLAVIAAFLAVTASVYSGTFRSYVPVTLTSERSGLVMEAGAKVKLRGVEVGRVQSISGGDGRAKLELGIDPDQIQFIPANVQAQIQVTTAFGAKFVDLVYPSDPSPASLAEGAVLQAINVSTEVNTIFENLSDLLKMVDPSKVNAVLTALAEAVRGKGERMGKATTDLNVVLTALNERNETIRQDWRSFKRFNDTYSAVASDIVTILSDASTTSRTVVEQADDLDALLLNTTGLARSGTELLAVSKDSLVDLVGTLESTTGLLNKYSPVYACWLQGATWFLENGGYDAWGGDNGRSIQLDVGLLFGNDPYEFPNHLPVIAAKGGPGGKPGCGSLPDATKNFPVRQLITNTGWGTGLDIRPNPGIGRPCWANYLPVTRANPEPASIRQCLPGPAPGPIPYPGAPPYGAALYGPGGVPLWPGMPPAR
ncbi:MCE family protein [Mycobacterium sp. SMC-4]|uniref:MCE family protein n=1 Tax=Mycobacterium sp. SMC-4 TaxID=2857059 RepID=UPI0021B45F78|nr:MCE family protein [Mycobacterium sp. SMC-4]UXA18972.1 MCE family protein [Mycobacterium sp. SMC-4]